MFQRYFLPALLAALLVLPASAQPARDRIASGQPVKSSPKFVALFKPALEKPAKSTVRVLLDGKDAALGTVVSTDGSILTKASEIKAGKLTIKSADGKERPAEVTGRLENFDLALIATDPAGLTPISWAPSSTAPVGNWVAIAKPTGDAAAVGVVSVLARTVRGPYGPPRVPTEQSGFLGIQLADSDSGATVGAITRESAADKAGLKPKDVILLIDSHEIGDGDELIATLLRYRAGDSIKVTLERGGTRMELSAKLGTRPRELLGAFGKDGRGEMQNSMGSKLSERRTGIPTILQTDAVIQPADCGGPLVDLDGQVIGVAIARAGRTESHVIPSETIQKLLPFLQATRSAKSAAERVRSLKAEIAKAEPKTTPKEVLVDARKALAIAEEDQWWADIPAQKGPAPRVVEKK